MFQRLGCQQQNSDNAIDVSPLNDDVMNSSNEVAGKDQPWKRAVEVKDPYAATETNVEKKGAIRLGTDFLGATQSG